MGVDYAAVLMVGKEFSSQADAAEFMRNHGIAVPDDDSEEMEDGLEEYLYQHPTHQLEFVRMNMYAYTDHGVLGYSISSSDPLEFITDVKNARSDWHTVFNQDAEIINDVQVY